MSKLIIEESILQEAEIVKNDSKKNKAIFRCIIQTADEPNKNKRVYPRSVLEQGMADCKDRMKTRAFLNELDHPIPSGNRQFDAIRQTSVLLDEVSHMILDYQFEGNLLKAEMETSSTPKGYLLHGLLTDKSGIGFSMRGMGDLQMVSGFNQVKSPLTIISYDAVSRPSHKAAVVDFNQMKFENESLLTESVNECNGLICLGEQCYLPNYFDKLVETQMIKFFKKWV
jgi:hypothetical protein